MLKRVRAWMTPLLTVVMAAGVILVFSAVGRAQEAKEFTLVNIEFEGSKVWVPGPIIVKKGDTVKIKAINNVKSEPPVHGLAIAAFGVQALVNQGKPETVEFKADKAGIFPITCHLHPPHVGAQLIVLEQSPRRGPSAR
ncbi:MAG: cupredoxin domain-containing protein [Nitrospinae bacterium]|nr:cupredoxin domain-containing protein [Nitrospinota bacterium]